MNKYNEENVRLAAYYNWQNAGCPNGKDEYFWNQAVKQLYGSCSCSSKTSCSSTKKTSSKSNSSTKTTSTSTKKTTNK